MGAFSGIKITTADPLPRVGFESKGVEKLKTPFLKGVQ
jgi:hypothetical protein